MQITNCGPGGAAGGGDVGVVRPADPGGQPPGDSRLRPPTGTGRSTTPQNAGDGDYQLKALREKVAADSESVPARLELAKAYQERGYPDVALEICRLAAARFPESGEVELALVRTLRGMNRRNEAIDSLEAFLETSPAEGAGLLFLAGHFAGRNGQWAEGEPSHRKAIELAGSRPTPCITIWAITC